MIRAEAREQVRHGPRSVDRPPDRGVGRQMVLSINRYRQVNQRGRRPRRRPWPGSTRPCANPITTVPESWPRRWGGGAAGAPAAADGRAETRPLGHLHPDTAVPAARRRRPRPAHHREPPAPAAPTGRRPIAGTRARRTLCGEVRNGSRSGTEPGLAPTTVSRSNISCSTCSTSRPTPPARSSPPPRPARPVARPGPPFRSCCRMRPRRPALSRPTRVTTRDARSRGR